MKRVWIGSLILGVLVVCGHSQSIAATYYVATTGSDANSGTKASPFRTINRSVKALVSGDTLFINSGVYAEELKNPLPSGLSARQPTKMTGPAADRPIIRPTTKSECVRFVHSRSSFRLLFHRASLDRGGDLGRIVQLGSRV